MLQVSHPRKTGEWSESTLTVLRERYLAKDENGVSEAPEEMFWRVAMAIARAEEKWGKSEDDIQAFAETAYDLMIEGYFQPNSPTLMNAGKNNGLQYSACYVLPVGDSLEEIFEAVKRSALIHKSGGGCIAGDSRVWTTFCGIEPIEVLVNRATSDGRSGLRHGSGTAYDVQDLNIQTVAMNPVTGETGLRRVTHVWRFDVPAENQVTVRMREGTVVQTSDWHPFMVLRGDRLVETKAGDLASGDVVLGLDRPDGYWPHVETRSVGDLTINPELGWLVGFTLGDGSFGYVPALRQYRVRWFSGKEDVLEKVKSVLARQGIYVSIQKDGRGLLSVATLNRRFVHDLLEACGLEKIGPKGALIRIPEEIAKSPLPVVRAFLAGLLDSDGYVAPDGSPSYSTVSEGMAEDLAALMSLLGYQPTVGAKPPHGKGRRITHTVQLCGLPQVNELANDLAPYLVNELRRERLKSESRRQTALRLPFREWRDRLFALGLVKTRGDKIGGSGPCASELNRWSCNTKGRCRRDDLLTIAGHVEIRDPEMARMLRRITAHGQEVKIVEPASVPRPYYDLTVEDWNTYAAGLHGLAMVHNTGFSFSRLRSKNNTVATTGGKASGPVSFLRVFNAASEAVKQGGTRRGANMGILRVDHPDVLEFIECKLDGGINNFNISVAITDKFMEALAQDEMYDLMDPRDRNPIGKLRAKDVFDKIVHAAWKTGDPGLVFIDKVNASPANPTPEVGEIEATNPCVPADTWVMTEQGPRQVRDILGKPFRVIADGIAHPSGEGGFFKTGTKPLVSLQTVEGHSLRLTVDHKVQRVTRFTRYACETEWTEAGELKPCDQVLLHDHRELRGWKGSYTEGEGYLLGLLVGDGTLKADKAVLSVWNPETRAVVNGSPEVAMPGVLTVMQTALEYAQALPHRADFRGWMAVPGRTENRMSLGHVKKLAAELGMSPGSKDITPVMERASSDFYRGFLRGFFDSDGSVQGSQTKGVSVRLAQSDRDRLLAVQRMLLRLGIASTVYEGRRPPQLRLLPDQHGGRKWYPTVEQHELAITGENILRFAEVIGFSDSDKALKLRTLCSAYKRAVNRERFTARVASVTASGTEDVYDVQIPGIHAFDANGFFAHNCGEQPLLPNEACNLGSLNLARFVRPYRGIHEGNGREKVDWAKMEEVVRFSVRFLDNVIDVNPYPLKDIDEMVKANRRIGLGIMGWSDMLILLDIPYDSEEALLMAQKVMSFIKEKGHDESSCLARERGYFPNWPRSIFKADRPLRNSTVTTVAPTGTISIIAGCSSGIEPLFAVAYSHIVGDRHLRFINPHFERIARERGFYAEELMEKVARLGTVQGLPEVPLDVQRLFKTAHDIPPEWHVRTQAAFQKSTDNGVSKTINLPNSATTDDVANAYLLAHDLGCLGITVFRDGCKEGQVLYKGTEGAVKGEGKETKVKPRPRVVQGVTYRINTPIGTAFITVNDNGSGEPFEVFANVGKAGSDIAAVAEATGRLMSLCLRLPSTLSARERLREIINQLSGIGGGRQMGFGKDRIRSLPDAVATVLAEHMGLREEVGDEGEEEDGGHLPLHLDLCPDCGHATLVFEEGCQKCHTCGYSMC